MRRFPVGFLLSSLVVVLLHTAAVSEGEPSLFSKEERERYHAMVVRLGLDKEDIYGFYHIVPFYSRSMMTSESGPFPGQMALQNLAEAMNKYTNIETDIRPAQTLDSKELFKAPFVLLAPTMRFQLRDNEVQNLGRYMREGGFLFIDDARAERRGPVDMAIRDLLRKALGKYASFERLPNNHPIYRSFFHFDGPPTGLDTRAKYRTPYLEGIYLEGRLVAVISNKGYSVIWGRAQKGLREERQLQFGVNVIVFALLQEGSITDKVMKSRKPERSKGKETKVEQTE